MRHSRLLAVMLTAAMAVSSVSCTYQGDLTASVKAAKNAAAGTSAASEAAADDEEHYDTDESAEASDEMADKDESSARESSGGKSGSKSSDDGKSQSKSEKEKSAKDRSNEDKSDKDDQESAADAVTDKDSRAGKDGKVSKDGKTDRDSRSGKDSDGKSDKQGKEDKNSSSGSSKTSDADRDADIDTDASDTDKNKKSESETDAETAEKKSVLDDLPKLGDEIHGFKVTDISDYELKDAKLISMDHEQSGAELLYIACDDPDKAFSVYFKTAADSDNGLPHVFEHATLGGSGKYPNADVFMTLMDASYTTFMNAFTGTHGTAYIMSSMSEEQLLKIADYYMDGVTDPLTLSDEKLLGRGVYHYVLESAEDDLTVTGALFNEMESDNSKFDEFSRNALLKLMYPQSQMSFMYGGYRDDIITVTLDQLKSYHAKYYHPSNMLIVMYGDMDYESYLEFLDKNYLSKYDKKEITDKDSKYIPWTGHKEAVVSFPATEDASAEGSSGVYYGISLGELPLYDETLMEVIAELLMSDSSTLKQAVEEAYPEANFGIVVYDDIKQPVLVYSLTDCDPGNAEDFRELIQSETAKLCKDGLNKELVSSVVSWLETSNAISAEEPGGVTLSQQFGYNWMLYDDRLSYLDRLDAFAELEEQAEDGRFDELMEEYLLNPAQSVLVEIDPEPGLREQMDEEFAARLADKKASMSTSELAQLVGKTAEYNTWSELSSSDAQQYIDELNVAKLDELSEDVQEAEIAEEELTDGVSMLSSEIEDASYLYSNILLDAAVLDYDEIHDYAFLGDLLGNLATENYSVEELGLKTNAIYNFSISPYLAYDEADDGRPHPYLKISGAEGSDDIEDTYELIEEIILNTDFSDTERIRRIASSQAAALTQSYNADPAMLAQILGYAASDERYRYGYYIRGFEYIDYLKDVASMSDKQAKAYAEKLQTVLKKLLNSNGLIYTAVGAEDSIDDGREAVLKLVKELDDTKLESVDYSKELAKLDLPLSIAAAVSDSVNYNGIFAAGDANPFEGNGTDKVIFAALQTSMWFPEFRYNKGAYGFFSSTMPKASFLLSYRDPGIAPTFEYYDAMPEMLGDLELTHEDVENAALKVYSETVYPLSPLKNASAEIENVICNKDKSYADETRELLRQIKKTTPEDVADAADKLKELVDDGARVTVGNSTQIKTNKELYERVINDLIK